MDHRRKLPPSRMASNPRSKKGTTQEEEAEPDDTPLSQYWCLDRPGEPGLARVITPVREDPLLESMIGLLKVQVTAYDLVNHWSRDPPAINLIEEPFALKDVLLPRQGKLLEERLALWARTVEGLNHSCEKRGTQHASGSGAGKMEWYYRANTENNPYLAAGLSRELIVEERLPAITGLFPDGIMVSGSASLTAKTEADHTLDFQTRMELAFKKDSTQEYSTILLDGAVRKIVERDERLNIWLPLANADLLDVSARREPWTKENNFPHMYLQGPWGQHVPRMLRAPDDAPRVQSAPRAFEDTAWYLVPEIEKVGEALRGRAREMGKT